MSETIDLFLITGFLGSGKTTFLKGVLKGIGKRKTGVLVNEFGSISIDGKLIERNGIRLTEINSGSIFCSCLKKGFVQTLISFSETDIDVLFIESSGMSDPSNIRRLLDGMDKLTKRPFRYRGAVVLVDPITFPKYVKVLAPVRNQVASGNFIIINKMDLADSESLENVENIVRDIQPGAYIYKTSYGRIPEGLLEDKITEADFSGESTNTPGSRVMTYSLECAGTLKKGSAFSFFKAIQPYLLRLKGFVKEEPGWLHIDYASGIWTEKPAEENETEGLPGTEIVMIGKGPEEFENLVRAEWRRFCGTEMDLFQ